jgi:DNA repair protein RadA/Sms
MPDADGRAGAASHKICCRNAPTRGAAATLTAAARRGDARACPVESLMPESKRFSPRERVRASRPRGRQFRIMQAFGPASFGPASCVAGSAALKPSYNDVPIRSLIREAPMSRRALSFVCQNCGTVFGRWQGKCDACGEWNTIAEEGGTPVTAGAGTGPGKPRRVGRLFALHPLSGSAEDAPRTPSAIAELDRVTGGGLVRGSVLLLGGDPGIGKSTLLIQAAAAIAQAGHRAVYISGEEAVAQVRLRAERLGLADAPVELAAETAVEDIVATLSEGKTPRLVVVDSIQTMWTGQIDSSPGTVSQVRGAAQILIRYAKRSGAAVILVGHVTKDGQIAGPRVVEHMVDAVLSFEGEGARHFRILRAVKNRFGPTDEIGVFEMTGAGLQEVANPSALFLSQRDRGAPGTAVFAGIEGTRPMLVEIQALVAPTMLGTPRRAVVGWDQNRLAMVLAVLEAHCGVRLSGHDVYLNVAGGLRIQEPGADLAAAAALVSSLANAPLPADAVYFGEISLSGTVRPVAQPAARLREAAKLGFARAFVPDSVRAERGDAAVALRSVGPLAEIVAQIAPKDSARRGAVGDEALRSSAGKGDLPA